MEKNGSATPGLILPTQKSYPAGAGNPSQATIVAANANSENLNRINHLAGGKKHKKHKKSKKYRGGKGVIVPQMKMSYSSTSGPGTDPNSQIANLSRTSTQGAADRALDNGATQKGGNTDWNWPCFSGGKKRCYKKSRNKKKRSYRSCRSKKRKY